MRLSLYTCSPMNIYAHIWKCHWNKHYLCTKRYWQITNCSQEGVQPTWHIGTCTVIPVIHTLQANSSSLLVDPSPFFLFFLLNSEELISRLGQGFSNKANVIIKTLHFHCSLYPLKYKIKYMSMSSITLLCMKSILYHCINVNTYSSSAICMKAIHWTSALKPGCFLTFLIQH